MNYLVRQICRIRLEDIPSMIKLLFTFIPAKIYKRIYKDVWVITEYPENARDNGYWFFKYVRENHSEKKAFYPIKKNASDYAKVEKLGNIIEFGGWKHYFLFWAATKFIGTTKYHGFPDERITAGLFEMKMHRFQYIFLNHGFARGISGIVNADRTNYDMIIAMSELEKEIITKINHQPEEKVKAIGFCRHDNLNDELLDNKLILIMPTWRRWLDYRHEKNESKVEEIKKQYLTSSYYKEYQNLLNNKQFHDFLEKNDMRVVLYLHGYAQMYSDYFTSTSNRVKIVKKEEYFVQDLLKQAVFLITDYSSVAFDYAYMKKAMLYFQFDAEEFARIQYGESELYTYEKNGFGPIVYTVDDVIIEMKRALDNKFKMDELYLKRVEEFFGGFGKEHCKNTYKLINEL